MKCKTQTNLHVIFLFYCSLNGGSCTSTTTGYLCQCQYPYTGPSCEGIIVPRPACACVVCPCPAPVPTAVIVNPCLPNPCQNNGGCGVVQNAARCYCPNTYTGYYCQFGKSISLCINPS